MFNYLFVCLIGFIKDINVDSIRSLESFRRVELLTQPGANLVPTIDCFSRPGSVQLVHENEETLMSNYNLIHSLEQNGLFTLL